MGNNNLCRLCSKSGNNYLNIFGDIGAELHLREIIDEHFKCEVNKIYFQTI